MKYKGCQIEVVNEAINDKEDLMFEAKVFFEKKL
jgi:hypothetical protein